VTVRVLDANCGTGAALVGAAVWRGDATLVAVGDGRAVDVGAALGLGGTAGVDADMLGAADGLSDTDGPAGVDEAILCCPLAVQAAAATAIVRQPAACRTRALRRRPPKG